MKHIDMGLMDSQKSTFRLGIKIETSRNLYLRPLLCKLLIYVDVAMYKTFELLNSLDVMSYLVLQR